MMPGQLTARSLNESLQHQSFHCSYGELEEDECEQVEQLVFCNQRQVAHEAGAFLNDRLLSEAEKSSPSKKKGTCM